jgi:hypothetical protein
VDELLEDGVLRVGVSGTLVSMRIAPALLGSFKGPGASLSGSSADSRNLQRRPQRRDSTCG